MAYWKLEEKKKEDLKKNNIKFGFFFHLSTLAILLVTPERKCEL